MKIKRRHFIQRSLLATAGVSTAMHAMVKAEDASPTSSSTKCFSTSEEKDAFKISIFSKNLQWLGYDEMAQVAKDMGFDGIDLTVRPGGHILPERVTEDLPKAVDAIRKAGLNVYMITTNIKNVGDPYTETILKTAGSLGIPRYRMGWINYDENKSIEESLMDIENQLSTLAMLNKKYNISADYQNHSGTFFGSPIWDLYGVLKRIKSPWIGSQYDIFHATVEGANAWSLGLKLLKSHIGSIDVKDFQWAKKNGKWATEVVPLGEGLVDFRNYFSLLKQLGIRIPISLHYEYDLGGAENGATSLAMKKEEVIAFMKKDCDTLKEFLRGADLIK